MQYNNKKHDDRYTLSFWKQKVKNNSFDQTVQNNAYFGGRYFFLRK